MEIEPIKHTHGDITIAYDEETGWYIEKDSAFETLFGITQCPFCDKPLYSPDEVKEMRRRQNYENDDVMAKLGRQVFEQYIGFTQRSHAPFKGISGPASLIVNEIRIYVDGEN